MLALEADSRRFREVDRSGPSSVTMPPPCRVLVVDDDEFVRAYLAAVLKSASYEVDMADSGNAALRLLHAHSYNMLLTDYEMPEMDGPTLCQRVRAEFPERTLYVLMFTVKNNCEDRYVGLKSGADDYLIKGSSKSEVLAKVDWGRRLQLGQHALALSDVPERQLALVDPRPHTRSFKYFALQMPKEIQRARLRQQALSVASCWLEGFEQLTQQYGHPAADEAVCAFADDARQYLRASQDWFARVGKDRFILVLSGVPFHGAERLARKLRHRYTAVRVLTKAGSLLCSMRINVTACDPRDGSTPLDS